MAKDKDSKITFEDIKEKTKAKILLLRKTSLKYFLENKLLVIGATVSGLAVLCIYNMLSGSNEFSKKIVVKHYKPENIENGRIFGSNKDIYSRKSRMHNRDISGLKGENKRLKEQLKNQDKRLDTLEFNLEEYKKNRKVNNVTESQKATEVSRSNAPEVQFSPTPEVIKTDTVDLAQSSVKKPNSSNGPKPRRSFNKLGPSVINFPVQTKKKGERNQVVVPSGSFVSATLLTGVEAPEGKALPTLLKANEAYVGPNKTRVDLTGCFFIGKSTGNLSIERVELQVVKLSCVSKSGRSFEKSVSGFVADDKDNSFAVVGSVNAKRDRVAALAFLSSIVEGIGKAVQQAQTTNQVNSSGGSSSIVSGDQAKYMAAGGAATAASRITEFYLKHAESLLPTINIGSGQKIYIVMQDKIELPNWYFKKSKSKNGSHFSYLSRVLE